MFKCILKMFVGLLSICILGCFGKILASNCKGPIKCKSLNNWPYQTRPTLVDLNYN